MRLILLVVVFLFYVFGGLLKKLLATEIEAIEPTEKKQKPRTLKQWIVQEIKNPFLKTGKSND